MHFKEHAGQRGGLHLNVVWDVEWMDQTLLARMAAECGFGRITHISAIGRGVTLAQARPGSSAAVHYAKKTGFRVVAYARKTGSQTAAGDDWPKRVRRWSASRAASREMGPRPHHPDWYWAAVEPPTDSQLLVNSNTQFTYWLLPDGYLPIRAPGRSPPPAGYGVMDHPV